MAVILLGVPRQIRPLLERAAAQPADHAPLISGPPVGEQVPHFSARDTDGELVDDRSGRAALLLFLSVGCEPCAQLAAQLRAAAADPSGAVKAARVPNALDHLAGLSAVLA